MSIEIIDELKIKSWAYKINLVELNSQMYIMPTLIKSFSDFLFSLYFILHFP